MKVTRFKPFKHHLRTKLKFGKYKGETLRHVIELDAPYILWCQLNVDGFKISVNAENLLNKTLGERNTEDDEAWKYLDIFDLPH